MTTLSTDDKNHVAGVRLKAPSWNLGEVVDELRAVRKRWREGQGQGREAGGRELPSPIVLEGILDSLGSALFPMRLGPPDLRQETENFYVGYTLDSALGALLGQVRLELRYAVRHSTGGETNIEHGANQIVRSFTDALPIIRSKLDLDVLSAFQGDPAARSVDEVLLCYPGVRAVIHHRLAHELHRLGVPLLARIISEIAHSKTGIDIHPGAEIGGGFFIDHGTGVVIGETVIIGERVRLYQAVTLGAKRFPVGKDGILQKGEPRHPIVEDDVEVGKYHDYRDTYK